MTRAGRTRTRVALAVVAALTLLAAGCAGAGGAGEQAPGDQAATQMTTDAAVDPDGEFSVYSCEPTTLVPAGANEVCATGVLDALFTGLVRFDPETSEPQLAVAESIETDDQITWTITIADGWTFHDGTPVTAESFVDAWNFGAYGPNAQANSYLYAPIAGFADLQCEVGADGVCVADPKAKTMSGLEAVDDRTIEVTLGGPYSQFRMVLGTPAFYPLPESFFADPAFNEAPVGNGPFQMDGTWEHDERIRVTRYDDYAGEPARAAAVEFRVYSDINTAYTDLLAGNLDVMSDLPPERAPQAAEDLGDRVVRGKSSSFTFLGFPLYDERFTDVRVRRAFSMAIDRKAITETLLTDQAPATGVIPPVIPGARDDACGQWCSYAPDRARALLEEAGGFDGPLELWFNAGGGHEAWMEAVANQLRTNLGISEITFRSLQPAEYAAKLDAFEITGPFRLAWVMDYPSAENYLLPLFSTAGGSNMGRYENPAVDQAIADGNLAADPDEAIAAYHRAEDIVLEDMPVIPLFFGEVLGGHSERVTDVVIDAFTRVNVADIAVVAP